MNGFEVIGVDILVVVVSVALDSPSRKWTAVEVTILGKKRATKKIDFVATTRTVN